MSYFGIAQGLGGRLLTVGVLPVLSIAILIAAVVAAGAPGDAPSWKALVDEVERLSASDATALLAAVVALGLILMPLQPRLVRLLEGYWGGSRLATRLANKAKKRQDAERQRLQRGQQLRGIAEPTPEQLSDAAHAADALRNFPHRDRLLPTRLGNVLRAAEDAAGGRYGLDTVATWPSLSAVLPETLRSTLASERDALDMAVSMCAAWTAGAVALVVLLAPHGLWLLLALAAVIVAWLSYAGAVAAAAEFGRTIRVAFDLHRFDLLAALHLPLPDDSDAEQAANEMLTGFMLADEPPRAVHYVHPPSADGADGEAQASGDASAAGSPSDGGAAQR